MDATAIEDYLQKLKGLYARMDTAYTSIAHRYGFNCTGCEDNCCSQVFHHHTLIEYYYLSEGIKKAGPALREEILGKAKAVVSTADIKGVIDPCPVNFDGLCSLYDWRPMICRLHGLPYVMRRPDYELVAGDGCWRFQKQNAPEIKLDRTPFYSELARIEKDLRQAIGFTGRYKKTTAEMVLSVNDAFKW